MRILATLLRLSRFRNWLLLLSAVLSGCEATSSSPLPVVHISEELRIENSAATTADEILVGPMHVATDSNGITFVADITGDVKVFDERGEFVRRIGSRGSGPGDLMDITSMTIDHSGYLVLADQLNSRITTLDGEGGLVSISRMDPASMMWPRQIMQTSSGDFVMLYLLESSMRMIHVFEADLETKTAEFAEPRDLWRIDESTARETAALQPGFLWAGDSEILYVPRAYCGEIFSFRSPNNEWTLAETFSGVDAECRFSGDTATSEAHESRGLFRMNDGSIVHFYRPSFGDSKDLRVELIGTDGQIRFHGVIPLLSVLEKEFWDAHPLVMWKDASDRIVLRDYSENGEPVVRVLRLEF